MVHLRAKTPAGQFEDIGTGSDWDINNNDPNLPQENTEQRSSSLIDPRNTVCSIRGCTYISRKNKHHVQKMHLPRIMWDNSQPPVKAEKIDDLNIIRREALVYLTSPIGVATGTVPEQPGISNGLKYFENS
jgi:hypothetical protein